MINNLPQGVKYEDTISDPWNVKPKSYNFMKEKNRISPCQAHAFSDEGAESEVELLPTNCIYNEDIWLCHEINKCKECFNEKLDKCIYHDDYNKCNKKNICEQCKID